MACATGGSDTLMPVRYFCVVARAPRLVGTGAATAQKDMMPPRLLKPAPVTLALFLGLAIPAALTWEPGSRVGLAFALFAVSVPGVLLVLMSHELGHVAGGLASGYRFIALICGPVAVSRVDGRLVTEWNRIWSLYGGIAMLAPAGGRLPPTRDAVVLFASGPLASLVLGVAFLALHFGLGLDEVTRRTIAAGTHTVWQLLAGGFTLMVGGSSLVCAVATLIPNALGGFTSDGAAIRMLLRGGPEAERLQTMNALMGRMAEGTRPRDWEAEYVHRAACVQDGSAHESAAASFALLHDLDRGDLAAAKARLARMQAASAAAPEITLGELRLAEAWLATADGRTDEARAALAKTEGAMVEEFSRWRVRAAILVAEGKPDEGATAAREGLALLQQATVPFAGIGAMERDWLTALAEGRLPPVLAGEGRAA